MAIQLNLTDDRGDYSAYARITSQTSDNNGIKTVITYQVSIWASQLAYESGKPSIDSDRYSVQLADLNSADFTGLYVHLHGQEKYRSGVFV